MAEPSPRIVKCPSCGKDVPWQSESRWRPFCSERCRNIDLGAWATEQYRVPATSRNDTESDDPLP